jgi:hypothetical protein
MGDVDYDRPYGDDGFADPRKQGWWSTVASAVVRSMIAVLAGMQGRQWPRQLPLDPPEKNRDYRP